MNRYSCQSDWCAFLVAICVHLSSGSSGSSGDQTSAMAFHCHHYHGVESIFDYNPDEVPVELREKHWKAGFSLATRALGQVQCTFW